MKHFDKCFNGQRKYVAVEKNKVILDFKYDELKRGGYR
jgi:hypothetical protein